MTKALRNSVIFFLVGVSIIFGSLIIKHYGLGISAESIHEYLIDITRDLGIAFTIGAIVFFLYEFSTRSAEKKEGAEAIMDLIFGTDTPKELWAEVKSEILSRGVCRSKMVMNVDFFEGSIKNKELDLQSIAVGKAVIRVAISYELKGLLKRKHSVLVTHIADQHMYDAALGLPCFTSAYIKPTNFVYDQNEIKQRVKAGVLSFPAVTFSPPDDNIFTVETIRYEIVNIPGLYTMVLPEMVLPTTSPDGEIVPAIQVNLNSTIRNDLDISVETWANSKNHSFKRAVNSNLWKFDGVMLPGQGFSIIFKTVHPLGLIPD